MEAYSAIVRRYQRDIFRLGYGFFHNRDDALEIVQETFLKIFERIDRFRNNSSFKNWMYRIASNLCIDFHRKRNRGQEKQRAVYDLHYNDAGRNPDEITGTRQEQAMLRQAIDRLPARQKNIFIMRHFSQMKFKDIAAALQLSVGTVKSLHHRAFHKIKGNVLTRTEES